MQRYARGVTHMVIQATETSADILIARYIEPHPAKEGKSNYRLKVEYNGYPVWAVMGDLFAGIMTPEEIAREYEIPREALDAVILYYLRHRASIDAKVVLNTEES